MLRDVIAGFLDSVTEREFDAPLLALLSARGFTDIHFTHGAFEFGKDVIAKGLKPPGGDTGTGDPATWASHQYAIQSKAGDLNLAAWREIRHQVDEARLYGLTHPSFSYDLPRAAVLLTTGRLTGGAAPQAEDYRATELREGRPGFEVWDREDLLQWMTTSPEAGLAGASEGPLLALAGAIDAGEVTLTDLERRGRAWQPPAPGSLASATTPPGEAAARQRRAAIEAAVLGNRLRRAGRLDLAAYTALLLLRAAWCDTLATTTSGPPSRSAAAAAAIGMFAGYAAELHDQAEPLAKDPHAMLTAVTPFLFAHVAYPVACTRLAEILGLAGLLGEDSGPAAACLHPDRIARTVQDLLEHQPGCAHPVSDSHAVSLIAPVLLTALRDPDAARRHLTRCAVWVADRYDPAHGGAGLASTAADPAEEIAYLLGAPYEHGPVRRPASYLATVITDLAAVIPGSAAQYGDIVSEFLAAGADPWLLQADEHQAQWRPDASGVTLTPNICYAEPLPPDGVAAAHHRAGPPPIPAWDALAITSVTRNRHSVAVLRDAATTS